MIGQRSVVPGSGSYSRGTRINSCSTWAPPIKMVPSVPIIGSRPTPFPCQQKYRQSSTTDAGMVYEVTFPVNTNVRVVCETLRTQLVPETAQVAHETDRPGHSEFCCPSHIYVSEVHTSYVSSRSSACPPFVCGAPSSYR